MPAAQPVMTTPGVKARTTHSAQQLAWDGRREPETPTTEAERRSCTSELGTDGGMAARWLNVDEGERA